MLPNVRFIIGAVAVSLAVLVGGFALFATIRVNHEPISRLASGAAPLPLVADSTAPPADTSQSFGVRFQVMQDQIAGASATLPPSAPARADDMAPPNGPAAVAAVEPEQAAPIAQASAAEPDTKPDAASAMPSAETPAASTDTAAAAPMPPAAPETTAAAPTPAPAESAIPAIAAAEPTAPAEPGPAAPATAAIEPPPAAEQALPELQAPPVQQAKEETKPAPAPSSEPPPKARHRTAHHTRVAASARRPVTARAAAPAAAQTFGGVGGPFVPVPSR
jgi:hypothetical protein